MIGEQQGQAVADELGADPVVRRSPFVRDNPMIFDQPMRRDPQVRRPPSSAGIYDVLDLILDKGIVIDAFVRVSLVGIELLTVDLRIVIASVDTYLRYAEGAERLQINERSDSRNIPEMVGGKMKGDAVKQGAKKLGQAITGGGGEEQDGSEQGGKGKGVMPALAGGMRKMLTRGVGRIVGRIAGDDKYEDQDDQGQEQRGGGGEQEEQQQARQREQKGEGGGGGGGGRHQPRGKAQPRRAKAGARR